MLVILENPNKEEFEEILNDIKSNDGYCPCKVLQNEDTKCICKEFREKETEGFCHCKLYKKVNEDKI